jgi:hypothetical protein
MSNDTNKAHPEAGLPSAAATGSEAASDKCGCEWARTGLAVEVTERVYASGRLLYERARCKHCGKTAWALGTKPPNTQRSGGTNDK